MQERVVACGAGFAGDRTEPAVALAASGQVDAVGLECLAERTLVPGLRARRSDLEAGYDPRLNRRLRPLLGVAKENNCRVISNLGAANPAAAGRRIVQLARELEISGLKVAAVVGDDVLGLADEIDWDDSISGDLLGAHAYLGADALEAAINGNADVIVTGRAADSALFSAELMPILDDRDDALAGATTIGHLLECSGQVTGGNFEFPDGTSLSSEDFANLGFPLAKVRSDGSAELFLLDGSPGRIDALTCTLQLLYEVHDPANYITPDAILDFTGISFDEIAPNRVRVSGARSQGRPSKLKVSGFIDQPGIIADVEIGYAGTHCLQRGKTAADALRLRLSDVPPEDLRIDLVGIDSALGPASTPASNRVPEVRVHVSARCRDAEMAQIIEDEVYALTLSGP
ncbi:MAG: acyclic terpene utilization AtuA family protein, partial [Hyphomicrobiaceae bacterium]